jgi:hypothetical protein
VQKQREIRFRALLIRGGHQAGIGVHLNGDRIRGKAGKQGGAAASQKLGAELTRQPFNAVICNFRAGEDRSRPTTQELAELAQGERDDDQTPTREEAAGAYVNFLDSMLAFYQASLAAAQRSTRAAERGAEVLRGRSSTAEGISTTVAGAQTTKAEGRSEREEGTTEGHREELRNIIRESVRRSERPSGR